VKKKNAKITQKYPLPLVTIPPLLLEIIAMRTALSA